MGEITAPRSLTSSDAALSFADSLAKLLDPKERAKISDDIKAHHTLNDTEAKKADDARALIKQHQGVLDETNRVSLQNKKDAEILEQQKLDFKKECETERQKISDKWSEVNTASEEAKTLYSKAESMINVAEKREDDLRKEKEKHAINVNNLAKESALLGKEKSDLEESKKKILALDEETKAKVEKLKQFNF